MKRRFPRQSQASGRRQSAGVVKQSFISEVAKRSFATRTG
jgi:hypothetical protein